MVIKEGGTKPKLGGGQLTKNINKVAHTNLHLPFSPSKLRCKEPTLALRAGANHKHLHGFCVARRGTFGARCHVFVNLRCFQ